MMSWNDLKKQTQLLIFMMNHEASSTKPFELRTDGEEAVAIGIAKNKRALGSQLHRLKLNGYVVNSYGHWLLTVRGQLEASSWMKKCNDDIEVPSSFNCLKKKAQETEMRDGALIIDLYAEISNLKAENAKLKEKIASVQKILSA